MNISREIFNNDGFTLVELMVSILLTGLISTGLFAAYRAQSTSYALQEDVAEMQQRVRAGMDMLTMEVRVAGYDPNITGDPGIISANSTSMTFTFVADDDFEDNTLATQIGFGTVDETNEVSTITYSFDDTDGDAAALPDALRRTVDRGNPTTLIEDVELVEFLFIDEDGTSLPVIAAPATYTTAQLDSVRMLTISILVRGANTPDQNLVGQGRTYTLGSGAVTPAYTDSLRRRLLITTVQFRNLGLIFN